MYCARLVSYYFQRPNSLDDSRLLRHIRLGHFRHPPDMGQGDIQLEPRAGKGTCSTEPEKQETTPSSSSSSLTLLDVLSNPIILDAVAPILLISGVLNLAATSRAFRDLISANPSVYRYLDLSNVRAARLRPNELSSGTPAQQTESEDDFYSRPLRNIFSTLKQKNILQHVQTLVLDGLSVAAELCHDIINGSDYNVRTLSILDVSNLNHAKLRASLAYACRKTRPEGSPKLRALYVFGDITPWAARMLHGAPTNASTNPGQEAQRVWSFAHRSKPDAWWSRKGCMIAPHHATQEWAECLIACQGIIAFDAVVCQGPRHYNSPAYGVKTMPARVSNQPAVARYAVKPCHMCGECPVREPEGGDRAGPGIRGLCPPMHGLPRGAVLHGLLQVLVRVLLQHARLLARPKRIPEQRQR